MRSKKVIVQFGFCAIAWMLTLSGCGAKMASTSTTTPATSASASPSPTPTPSQAPSPTPTPSGTSSAGTVISHIEEKPWLTCGNCGNNGAAGSTASYSDTLGIATPSEDGSATEFNIAATVPFTNGYFYQEHTPVASQMNALTYAFDI